MIRTKLSQGKSKRPCRTGMIKQPKEIFLLTFNSFRDSNIFLCKISLLKIGVVKNMNKHKSEIVTFMRNFGDDFRNYFTTNSSWRIATNALKLCIYTVQIVKILRMLDLSKQLLNEDVVPSLIHFQCPIFMLKSFLWIILSHSAVAFWAIQFSVQWGIPQVLHSKGISLIIHKCSLPPLQPQKLSH